MCMHGQAACQLTSFIAATLHRMVLPVPWGHLSMLTYRGSTCPDEHHTTKLGGGAVERAQSDRDEVDGAAPAEPEHEDVLDRKIVHIAERDEPDVEYALLPSFLEREVMASLARVLNAPKDDICAVEIELCLNESCVR